MKRILLSSALLVLASAASAQTQVSPGWSSFSGCWVPVANEATVGSRVGSTENPVVCVVPSGANAAELATFVGGRQTELVFVEADGNRRNVNRQGCAGWEKSEFSADGRRLYLRSEQTCAGGLKRTTTGIFALASNGDWINVANVDADSANSVVVSRYAATTIPASIPADVRSQFAGRELSDRTARTAAQREVSANAVIEASKFTSTPAVEAWLAELEQDFELDENLLVRLVDAGVAPSVIDVMVAVSNPKVFSVRATGSGVRTDESEVYGTRRDRYASCISPVLDPWAWYSYDPCDPYRRYSYYRSYRYRYGYDQYYGNGYYSPYYGYGNYGNPVVIIVNGSGTGIRHGRMTKDGYRSGGTTSGSSGSSSRGAGVNTSRGSSSGSSSSGGGDGGRTATRKPSDDSGRSSSQPTATEAKASSSTSSSSGEASSSSGRTATRKPPAA
jgi:hypothetical protein